MPPRVKEEVISSDCPPDRQPPLGKAFGRMGSVPLGFPWGKLSPEATDEGNGQLMSSVSPHPALRATFPPGEGLGADDIRPCPDPGGAVRHAAG